MRRPRKDAGFADAKPKAGSPRPETAAPFFLPRKCRRFWPKPLLGALEKILPTALERFESGRPKSVIPERLRPELGRVLCIYGDAGWGEDVARGKYGSGRFSEALVAAAADLIRIKWKPGPPPQLVTAVPSQRHEELVRDFAQRLAMKLGVPFVATLKKRRKAEPQKVMQNSPMQLRNVLDAFEIIEPRYSFAASESRPATGNVHSFLKQLAEHLSTSLAPAPDLPPVPMLLVDDMVDSGWTLTLAAVLLRQHGSGPVYPFALAKASPRGG